MVWFQGFSERVFHLVFCSVELLLVCAMVVCARVWAVSRIKRFFVKFFVVFLSVLSTVVGAFHKSFGSLWGMVGFCGFVASCRSGVSSECYIVGRIGASI